MTIALAISSVLEPMLVLSGMAVLAGWQYGLSPLIRMYYVLYLILFTVLVAVIRLVMAKHSKSNWDLSDRKKRVKPLFVLTAVFAVNTVGISLFGNRDLTFFHMLWLFWALGYALLTTKIKVSGHLSVATLATGILIRWFGWQVSPILLVLPVLAWSRLALKRHTVVEVVGGTLYSAGILLLITLI